MMKPKAEYLFEVSWEICNKAGGIYTVIKSKVARTKEQYKKFFLIGPYVAKKAAIEFQQMPPPGGLREIFESLKTEGIECYYGKWMIKEKPEVILIDFSKFMRHKDGIKGYLWEKFQIDSLKAGADFDEPVIWAWAVGKLLEKIAEAWKGKIVAQFHEWLSGAALFYIKDKKVPVASVFTTHATILGRTLAGSERPLYEILDKIDPEQEARNYNIQAKHLMEKAAALKADIFTTVSEITGLEAEHILGRKPDVLLPNGLDFERFPDLEEIPTKHKAYKAKIKEFIMPYFFPYYSFDLEKALFFYISGRYELRNKGVDVFIEALGKLNERLRKEKSEMTIITFILIPADRKAMKLKVVESKSLFEDIEDDVEDYMRPLREKIIYAMAQKKLPTEEVCFTEDFLFDMKKHIIAFKKEGRPSITTHDLANPNDAIYQALLRSGLDNGEEDKVKVIYYPSYLSSSDGLLDLDYYPAIWGCHFGIFPSYYEPWGYTPLESAAYGVPAITTDLAGFGRYVEKNLKKKENPGIIVLKRKGRKYREVVEELAKHLYWYATLPKKKRIQNKITAEHFAPRLDWKYLIAHYIEAHNKAVDKKFK